MAAAEARMAEQEVCDYCGSAALEWRKCKQLCTNCGAIVRSCADLEGTATATATALTG